MRIRRAMWVILGVFVVTLAAADFVRGAEERNKPAELKVLDRWIGEWDLEVTIKPNEFLRQGSKTIMKTSIKWTVNDRILRCDAEGQGVEGEKKFASAFTWISTHDPRKGGYTSTVFWSNVTPGEAGDWGGGEQGLGTWDEKEKTMTTRTVDKENGLVGIGVTQWIDKDTHRFVQSTTDANGKVVMEMAGLAKRRK